MNKWPNQNYLVLRLKHDKRAAKEPPADAASQQEIASEAGTAKGRSPFAARLSCYFFGMTSSVTEGLGTVIWPAGSGEAGAVDQRRDRVAVLPGIDLHRNGRRRRLRSAGRREKGDGQREAEPASVHALDYSAKFPFPASVRGSLRHPLSCFAAAQGRGFWEWQFPFSQARTLGEGAGG